jgi:very-short-patch-repair endonuclease
VSAESAPAPPGWPVAFRGSAAIAAGLVTAKMLRGPRYLRLFPDTYVRRAGEPPDLRLRSLAAYRYVQGRGVLSGYSAAVLLGAECAGPDAPAEVTVLDGGQRAHDGLRVPRGAVPADEVRHCRDTVVTTSVRTAYDLGRRPDLVEAVVAVDALANAGRFDPVDVLEVAKRHAGSRRCRDLRTAVALADRRAGSPMETRLRLILVLRGLPKPEVQYPVLDDVRRRAVWLDLAYPEHRIGIEYEGGDHGRPERVLLDAGRYTRLVDARWRMYRFTKYQVHAEPDEIAATVARALAARPPS